MQIHGNPGDYAWGRGGLDAIITQVTQIHFFSVQLCFGIFYVLVSFKTLMRIGQGSARFGLKYNKNQANNFP